MSKDILLQVLEYQLKVEFNGIPNLKIDSVDKHFNAVLSDGSVAPVQEVSLMPLMVLNQESGEVSQWTIEDLLEEINRDRNYSWIDYDESDFLEGWFEWVEGESLMLVQ